MTSTSICKYLRADFVACKPDENSNLDLILLYISSANITNSDLLQIRYSVPKSNISEKSIFDLPITISTNQFIYIQSNILANFIETDKNFRCGIRVVIITRNKKGGHYMLWSGFLNLFYRYLSRKPNIAQVQIH
jgi:hypothetical protein